MYYPAAFDTEALNILERHIPTLIPVSEEEARRFTCNAIVVEKNVVMNHGCPRISSQLQMAADLDGHALKMLGAGIFGLRGSSERVYQGWRQRKVPRSSRPLWIAILKQRLL